MTHRNELRGRRIARGHGVELGGEGQKGNNWDNCNSIIYKIYF